MVFCCSNDIVINGVLGKPLYLNEKMLNVCFLYQKIEYPNYKDHNM